MSNLSKINDDTLVIVNIKKPSTLYTFVEEGDGMEELQRAIDSYRKDAETWQSHIINYPSNAEHYKKYLQEAQEATFIIVSLKEYEEIRRKYYLDRPLKEIDAETWDNMLNVLPPLKWVTIDGVNEFLLSEFLSGPYTDQYARKNGKYYTKIVDAYDKTTWLHNFLNKKL